MGYWQRIHWHHLYHFITLIMWSHCFQTKLGLIHWIYLCKHIELTQAESFSKLSAMIEGKNGPSPSHGAMLFRYIRSWWQLQICRFHFRRSRHGGARAMDHSISIHALWVPTHAGNRLFIFWSKFKRWTQGVPKPLTKGLWWRTWRYARGMITLGSWQWNKLLFPQWRWTLNYGWRLLISPSSQSFIVFSVCHVIDVFDSIDCTGTTKTVLRDYGQVGRR